MCRKYKVGTCLLQVALVVVTTMMVVSLQGTMAIRVPTRFEVGGPLGWGFPRYPTFCDDWQSSNMLFITGDSFGTFVNDSPFNYCAI